MEPTGVPSAIFYSTAHGVSKTGGFIIPTFQKQMALIIPTLQKQVALIIPTLRRCRSVALHVLFDLNLVKSKVK